MQLSRGSIYGLLLSLLLFSLGVALQQSVRSWAPPEELREAGGAPGPAAVARSKSRAAARSRSGLSGGSWSVSFEAESSGDDEPEASDPATSAPSRSSLPSSASARSGALTTLARASAEGFSDTPASDQGATAGSTGGGDGAPAGQSDEPSVKAITFGESQGTACGSGRRDFSLENLRDLHVCVAWQGLAGTYVERLKVFAPNGNVYQVLPVAFVTPGTSAPAGGVEFEGRRLETTQAGRGAQNETLVLARLPVAGTFISQHSLVGLWTVEVSLNGQAVNRNTFLLNRGG